MEGGVAHSRGTETDNKSSGELSGAVSGLAVSQVRVEPAAVMSDQDWANKARARREKLEALKLQDNLNRQNASRRADQKSAKSLEIGAKEIPPSAALTSNTNREPELPPLPLLRDIRRAENLAAGIMRRPRLPPYSVPEQQAMLDWVVKNGFIDGIMTNSAYHEMERAQYKYNRNRQVLPTEDGERQERLEEQAKNNPCHSIVNGNLILKQGLGLFSRRRMLLLTEGPKLYYCEPNSMAVKGEIPWSSALIPEPKDFRIFYIHTPNRTYNLDDPAGFALEWLYGGLYTQTIFSTLLSPILIVNLFRGTLRKRFGLNLFQLKRTSFEG